MFLDKLDAAAQSHESLRYRVFVVSKLVANGSNGGWIHLMLQAHQILDDAGVPPSQDRVDASHFGVKPVIGLVADGNHGGHATRGVAD